MSTKVTDMAAASGCQICHDILDGRDTEAWEWLRKNAEAAMLGRMLDGLTETHSLLLTDGIITIKDGRFV
jgi:hypothetical protein